MGSQNVFDFQTRRGQRPLAKGRTAIFVLGLIAIFFTARKLTFWLFGSGKTVDTGSYTNEELNDILKGDKTSDENEFNIHRRPISDLKLAKPYLSPSTLELYNYNNGGNVMIGNDMIRIVADQPHQAGHVFSKSSIPSDASFEMELEFYLHGLAQKNGLYGDGMALWLVDRPLKGGTVFGMEDNWKGIGLFIDTFQNNKNKAYRARGFPYASLQLNHGQAGHYNKDTDGADTELAGCSLTKIHNLRSEKSKMRLIYLRESGYLSVDFDLRNNGNWKNCFTLEQKDIIPANLFIGVSGETGDLSHNVDLHLLEVSALYDDEGNAVKSITLINEDLQHHLQEESSTENDKVDEQADVVTTLQRNRLYKKQRTARNGRNRRRTLTRLHKLQERLKKRTKEENKVKYNGHESALSYYFSKFTTVCTWVFVLIVVYIISIFVRVHLNKKRYTRSNYYRGALIT